jgi:hypothetical protein
MEFDCRSFRGALSSTPPPRIHPVPLIFMRETHYIGRYDGDGIEFACPRLIIELPNRSAAAPASLLAALDSPDFRGFSDLRFTSELWDMPPATAAGDFNVMTHAWLFGHLDLALKLQSNAHVVIGAFELDGIEACPVEAPAQFASSARQTAASTRANSRAAGGGDNKQALPVNCVQRARVSLHMKRGSPAFSPNNCKLRLKNRDCPCSFWLLKGDPATRRAMVSFVCLLPPQCSSTFAAVMAQQRQCTSEAALAPPGASAASLYALLACLRSLPSLAEVAAKLEASLMVTDDSTHLTSRCGCDAEAGAVEAQVQLDSVKSGHADAGGEAATQGCAQVPTTPPNPEAIRTAIKSQCGFDLSHFHTSYRLVFVPSSFVALTSSFHSASLLPQPHLMPLLRRYPRGQ